VSGPTCSTCGGPLEACGGCGAEDGARKPANGRPALSLTARVRSLRGREAPPLLFEASGGSWLRLGRDRDRAAAIRDRGAEDRDTAADVHDREGVGGESTRELGTRAARDRELAAIDRARAADDRVLAAADRARAAIERAEALEIRAESAGLLERAGTDDLTGARTRQVGLAEAARELERAWRTGTQLMLAFVDVDGLKQLNDSLGHQAGDALLALVGHSLRANLRPYDVVVRYGGDEFVCAMPDLSPPEARARFKRIAHALAAVQASYSISFGLAQAWPTETLPALVARADADLLAHRACRRRIA
jgi:diguanylate cyclase (GGDEF)-like protein